MASLRDAKPTSHAGIQPLTLTDIKKQDGEYGKQLQFTFASDKTYKDDEGNDVTVTYLYWHKMTSALSEKYTLNVFLKNLSKWVDVRACATDKVEAQAKFDNLVLESRTFDDQDENDIQAFESEFIKAMIGDVLGKKVNVVLAYKGKYLNIPNGKANDYNLPFGFNPYMAPTLPMYQQVAEVAFNGQAKSEDEAQW